LTDFQGIMPIDSDLNKVLLVIGLQDAAKDAIAKGLPTCKDLKDLFMDMADDKTKAEANFHLIVDTKIVTDIDIDICRVMFVFDWFLPNIVDPNFAWTNFTRALYGMSLTNDREMWRRQPRPPLLLQARIPPRSVVLLMFQPM
jgi:hypothetical protein